MPSQRSGSIAVVLGTRPEIIKLAFVIKGLGDSARVIHTGQHYDFGLSESFLHTFGIGSPSLFLGIGGMTRGSQIGSAVNALDEVFVEDPPIAVVVQGDTNSTLAGAIAANAHEVPLVHVEAGLRSRDRRMPEEHNRVVTDHLGDLLCAPTTVSRDNLLNEGIDASRIALTGNTVVEAVERLMPSEQERQTLIDSHDLDPGEFVLSTFHRPENVDDPDRFSLIIKHLAAMPYPVLLSLHPRSRQKAAGFGLTPELEGIQVVDPLGYREFLGLSAGAAFLVSDSGGVQEESSVHKRPVLVVRRSTERPEVLGSFARLIEPAEMLEVARTWLSDPTALHRELEHIASPYGDGTASDAILNAIEELVT